MFGVPTKGSNPGKADCIKFSEKLCWRQDNASETYLTQRKTRRKLSFLWVTYHSCHVKKAFSDVSRVSQYFSRRSRLLDLAGASEKTRRQAIIVD